MKKLVVLLVLMMVLFPLTACAAEEAPVEEPKSLVIFQNKVEIDEVMRTYAEAWGAKNGVEVTVKTCGGDACAYGTQILAEFQSNEQPDIFVIEGMGGFNIYRDKILDLSGAAWAADTDLELTVDGTVFGFPVAVEGWGMGFNKDILDAAGVDAEALKEVSLAEYEEVFTKIQAYFDANGMDDYSVVSMAAGPGMHWVTGLHNFNGYLSAGLDYSDSTVIDKLNNKEVDAARLSQLADWAELLFRFANQKVLTTGTYDDQVGLFAKGQAAFIHQGNWTDSSYADSDFVMGYLPHATMTEGNSKIFIGAPSYYVINSDSANTEVAKQFLEDLAASAEGHDYMVNQANMVPAFNSVTLTPKTPLSAAVMEWNKAGKAYAWWQNDMPADFGMGTLGPIYELFAKGEITKAEFIDQLTAAITQ
mgnify:CR=1 FL=1